jgi:hypothetical protein
MVAAGALCLLEVFGAGAVVKAQTSPPAGDPGTGQALASQPLVPALRDGTLGIPSVGAGGVSALINNQIAANSGSYRADFFAQVGRLELSDSWDFDILGETFSTPIPTVAITPPSARPPLVGLKLETFEAIGFRLSASTRPKKSITKDARDCLNWRRQPGLALSAAQINSCQAAGVDMNATPTDADDLAALAEAHERAIRGWTFTIGGRLLYAGDGTNPVGLAGEVAGQHVGRHFSAFLSGAVLGLRKTQDVTGPTIVEAERVTEAKLAAGASWRFSRPAGSAETDILPKLGVYVAASRNWWTNPYATAGSDADIHGYQLEGSLYTAGHFSGGFSGLFAFSVLRPYGHESDYQYVISVAPSLGSPLPK